MAGIEVLDEVRSYNQDAVKATLEDIVNETAKRDAIVDQDGHPFHLNYDLTRMTVTEVFDDNNQHKSYTVFPYTKLQRNVVYSKDGYTVAQPCDLAPKSVAVSNEIAAYRKTDAEAPLQFAHLESIRDSKRSEIAKQLTYKYGIRSMVSNRFVVLRTTCGRDGHDVATTVLFDRQNVDKLHKITWLSRDSDGKADHAEEYYYMDAVLYVEDSTGKSNCKRDVMQLLRHYADLLDRKNGAKEGTTRFGAYSSLVDVVYRNNQFHPGFAQARLRVDL